jgi:hypothetical protein
VTLREANVNVFAIRHTLTGVPKQIYQLWNTYLRPRGYKLRVQIVDWPDGMPGDIAMTLSWQ